MKIIGGHPQFFYFFFVKKLQVTTPKNQKKKLQVVSGHLQFFYPTGIQPGKKCLKISEKHASAKGNVFFFIPGKDYFRITFAQNRVSE